MKKILFATTALVASTGFAMADVNITGNAEMGIKDTGIDNPTTTSVDEGAARFHSAMDIDFALRAESDNGISFGADIDLDEAGRQVDAAESVFVSAGGLTVTMGDTDGAFDARVAEMALAGSSLADDETIHGGFNTGDFVDGVYDGQVMRLDYTFSGVTVSASIEQADNQDGFLGPLTPAGVIAGADPMYGIGISYDTNLGGIDLGLGLAYQTFDWGLNAATIVGVAPVTGGDVWGASVVAGFGNGFSAGLTYSEFSTTGGVAVTTDHWGIGVGYEQGPIAVGANYGEFSGGGITTSGFGLAAAYDFGGGLSANLGYGNTSVTATPDVDTWSLGLRMNF